MQQAASLQQAPALVGKVSLRSALQPAAKKKLGRAARSTTRAQGEGPLGVLRAENAMLRNTIAAAEGAVTYLEGQLRSTGLAVPPPPAAAVAARTYVGNSVGREESAEDFWSPTLSVPDGQPFIEQYGLLSPIPDHDGTDCLKWDPSLWSHAEHFKYRWHVFKSIRQAIDDREGGLDKFTQGYRFYGLNRGEHEGKAGIWYREWAPAAKALALIGEYNAWEPRPEHWAIKNDYGVWQLFLPDNADGSSQIGHRTKIKVRLETAYGEWVERIPAWIKWATQEWNEIQFNGAYYAPPEGHSAPGELHPNKHYTFKYPRPARPRALRIYECHVGMSSNEPKVNSYVEFRDEMLPRIRKLGYNSIQIMAIQEHAYYGSFGYHVTNFFGVSSRSGTPDELKSMIDEAHRLGIVVLMDIVHSHASKNTMDGINMFDGSDAGYFHGGGRGYHWMWDSRCFNYGNWETLRFLLSNARWWIDEYKFDGYRFDGVTSMMYHHHGLQTTFTGNYDEYFGMATDVEAVVYLMLVNNVIHDFFPTAITIGEDVSGMPTFCRPWQEGGVGFDYRLNMAIADKWIEVLEESDWGWNMGNLVHTMTNRRYAEPCVGYAESHDQALVGDKTIAFWLMDKDMYDNMAIGSPSAVVDRGIAIHKMIRLLTMALGGESYLNFMGNEFGHPEWIDFPRDDTYDTSTGAFVPGNGGSMDKCRRRWDLSDAENLKYKFMVAYDRAIMHLDKAFGFVAAPHTWVSRKDETDKVIIMERGDLLIVFNFHPVNSYTDFRVGCYKPGPYKVILSSDEDVFGGYRNVTKDSDVEFQTQDGNFDNRPNSIAVYAPCRTVVVYAPAEFVDAQADTKMSGIPGLGVEGIGPYFAF